MRVFYKPYKKNRKHIIAESNTGNVLDTFRKIFSQAVVDSTEMTFEYDSNNLFIIFDTFNDHFFNGRLKRIQFSLCSKDDFAEILKLMNKDYDTDYYAAYIPQYTTSQNQTRKETIFIIDSYGKMTFKFAISCMLHEMIHYYDMHYGQLGPLIKQNKYIEGIEHFTPTFTYIQNIAESEGLKIMKTGDGKQFEKLNDEIAKFKPLSEEECKTQWQNLVARLEAGEDIPGVALTPSGTIAFLFLD